MNVDKRHGGRSMSVGHVALCVYTALDSNRHPGGNSTKRVKSRTKLDVENKMDINIGEQMVAHMVLRNHVTRKFLYILLIFCHVYFTVRL